MGRYIILIHHEFTSLQQNNAQRNYVLNLWDLQLDR